MICELCNKQFPITIVIDGKRRNLCSRRYCLECTPFGTHNTIRIHAPETQKNGGSEHRPIIKNLETGVEFRECSRCKTIFELNQFYRKGPNKSSYRPECKKCFNMIGIESQRKRKIEAVEYKGGKCCNCGYDRYFGALEFHHINPLEKDFNLSKTKYTCYSLEKIKAELDKCICVCANCHREIHNGILSISDILDKGIEPKSN